MKNLKNEKGSLLSCSIRSSLKFQPTVKGHSSFHLLSLSLSVLPLYFCEPPHLSVPLFLHSKSSCFSFHTFSFSQPHWNFVLSHHIYPSFFLFSIYYFCLYSSTLTLVAYIVITDAIGPKGMNDSHYYSSSVPFEPKHYFYLSLLFVIHLVGSSSNNNNKRLSTLPPLNGWDADASVTRFGEISPLWHNVRKLGPLWMGWVGIRQNFELTLANFTFYGAKSHRWKWPNIIQTI